MFERGRRGAIGSDIGQRRVELRGESGLCFQAKGVGVVEQRFECRRGLGDAGLIDRGGVPGNRRALIAAVGKALRHGEQRGDIAAVGAQDRLQRDALGVAVAAAGRSAGEQPFGFGRPVVGVRLVRSQALLRLTRTTLGDLSRRHLQEGGERIGHVGRLDGGGQGWQGSMLPPLQGRWREATEGPVQRSVTLLRQPPSPNNRVPLRPLRGHLPWRGGSGLTPASRNYPASASARWSRNR